MLLSIRPLIRAVQVRVLHLEEGEEGLDNARKGLGGHHLNYSAQQRVPKTAVQKARAWSQTITKLG